MDEGQVEYRCRFIILEKYMIDVMIKRDGRGWLVSFLDAQGKVTRTLTMPEERPQLPLGVNAISMFSPNMPESNFAASLALTIHIYIGKILDGTLETP